MLLNDRYHKWVEWSDEDRVYIGKCPDVITVIHGDDPRQVYAEVCEVVEEVLQDFVQAGRTLPAVRVRPMSDVR